MAFPVDAAQATTAVTSGGTAWTLNLLSGITAGDILVMAWSVNNTRQVAPSGGNPWTRLAYAETLSSSTLAFGVYVKVADGSEGTTDTANFTTTGSGVKGTAVCWRITGGDTGTTPEATSVATAASTAPDPTNLAPAGGSKDYLWLWTGGSINQPTMPPTGSPTGYSNPVGVRSGGTGSAASKCTTFGASKQATGSSEDPPSWTISTSSSWGAVTVAIYPAPPAGFIPRYPAINFQDPAVLAKAWKRTRGIFVPKLWTPEGATI